MDLGELPYWSNTVLIWKIEIFRGIWSFFCVAGSNELD
jgi:hypothetical protein